MNTDESQTALQYGLIAEEVATVIPELVYFIEDVDRAPTILETVYYQHLTPMLLAVCKQQALDISALRSDMETSMARIEAHMLAMQTQYGEFKALISTFSPT